MGFAMDGQGVECTLDLLFVANAALGPWLELGEKPMAEIVIGEQAVEIASGNQPIARDRAFVPSLNLQHGEKGAGAGRSTNMHLVAGDRQAGADIRAAGDFEGFFTFHAGDDVQ